MKTLKYFTRFAEMHSEDYEIYQSNKSESMYIVMKDIICISKKYKGFPVCKMIHGCLNFEYKCAKIRISNHKQTPRDNSTHFLKFEDSVNNVSAIFRDLKNNITTHHDSRKHENRRGAR